MPINNVLYGARCCGNKSKELQSEREFLRQVRGQIVHETPVSLDKAVRMIDARLSRLPQGESHDQSRHQR
jgi:hypothetical protein